MKSAAGLFLGLSTLLVSGVAEACSYSSIVFSGLDNYAVYDSHKLEDIRYDGMNIALVKVRKLKSLPINIDKVLRDNLDTPDTLYELQLEVIDVLQGTFSEDETIVVPKMSNEGKKEFQLRLNRNTDFNFWDGFQLTRQASTWYGNSTSCGPYGEIVLENAQYYLMGRMNMGFSFIEPVFGPEDNFVKDMRNLVEGNDENPLRIDASSFLANMDGYKIFDVTACPPTRRENSDDRPLRYRFSHL